MEPFATVSKKEGTKGPLKLHSLPCKVKYTGPAKVEGNFIREPKKAEEVAKHEGNVLLEKREVAVFRGHGLEGATLVLPQGYRVHVLKERNNIGRRLLDVEASDEKFVCWETEQEVIRSPLVRALRTLSVAEALATEDDD